MLMAFDLEKEFRCLRIQRTYVIADQELPRVFGLPNEEYLLVGRAAQ
jgi:hypothetical protein